MRKVSAVLAASMAALLGLSAALAQSGGAPSATVAGDPAQAGEAATVDGYRSARFGMTEAEVKKAIKADFSVDDPTRTVNGTQRTTALVVSGKSLIPDTPPATITYILGATTAKLIQVNIVWGGTGGVDAKQIAFIANALLAYFQEKGSYAKDSVAVNQNLQDGSVLVFRGADAQGRAVVVHLVPVIDPAAARKADKDKPLELKKAALRLSYVANPAKPDVFRIEKGRF